MKHKIVCANCLEYLVNNGITYDTIFADPPDGIGTKYAQFNDTITTEQYIDCLNNWLRILPFKDHWTQGLR